MMNATREADPCNGDETACAWPLVSAGTSHALAERVLDLEAFWLPRHPSLPFHTLGATNYYDITANPARPYERLAQQYNPLLRACFAELYDALAVALGERLQAPVTWLAGAALPGFHVFGAHPAFAASHEHDVLHGDWFARRDGAGFPGNPIHVDTAHLALGLAPEPDGAGRRTVSFTLPLRVPRDGAGMKRWPLRQDDLAGLTPASRLARLQCTPARHVAYRPGMLFLHTGDCFHQARGFPTRQGDYRITLQGHGAWLDHAWRLFW
ncbi:hypothetical protein [Burkholderia ubonensis]|nr:hypothetical protein [Burkholderia ubonensis]